ncbi:MAG TPA: EamA family transporter RarD [Candidatus Krumholzibacteria bacterium]|nr:EamA family transporter RarD [Candidatus Krumholzibacteria bacterium]HPD72699.1 EamA family transporter RarD [Candidatus Krumholzibacteria bacterium]HRY40369.1 EamA family transporter RarD [Candidatus Krumholzibacteria bacterium]
MPADRSSTHGVWYGLAAYVWWGLCPIYFKAVAHVPPGEILAHRIVWSLVLLVLLLGRRGDLATAWRTVRDRRTLAVLAATTVLVAGNWFAFIYAIANDRLLEASLGYFVNPLVNVLLGLVCLRERLRRLQWASLALAAAGVAVMSLRLGGLPAISLFLAFSFGFYGLLRKVTPVGGVVGLAVETALLAPAALAAFWLWHGRGALVFGHLDRRTDLLLAASGLVTALPLVWFANSARRLRYATLGFLQYASPTGQFLLAVLVYGEPFSETQLASFALIWCALGLFSVDALRASRRPAAATTSPGAGRTPASRRRSPG